MSSLQDSRDTLTIAFALLASGLAMASPLPKIAPNAVTCDLTTTTTETASSTQFAAQADCDFFQCVNFIESAGRIAAVIPTGQVAIVLACVASGTSGVCSKTGQLSEAPAD